MKRMWSSPQVTSRPENERAQASPPSPSYSCSPGCRKPAGEFQPIAFGKGLTRLDPGSLDNLQMVVADADAVRAELLERGIEVSDVDELQWGRFVFFADPDGNGWALQQLPGHPHG